MPARDSVERREAIPRQDTLIYNPHSLKLSDDSIRLTKKGGGSDAVDHFFGQALDVPGKTTCGEFLLEFVPPHLDAELAISSAWVFHPQNFGGALNGYSAQAIANSNIRT